MYQVKFTEYARILSAFVVATTETSRVLYYMYQLPMSQLPHVLCVSIVKIIRAHERKHGQAFARALLKFGENKS